MIIILLCNCIYLCFLQTRVAALSAQSKVTFYRMLDEFEQEEVGLFNMYVLFLLF